MQTEKSNNINKRKKPTYFVDRKLLPRVKEFLDSRNHHGATFDVEEAVIYLQSTFPEYRRQKQNSLRSSITKAFNVIHGSNQNADDEKLGFYEDRYLQKRQKRSRSADMKVVEDEESDDSDFSLTDEPLVEYKDTNAANNIMKSLYKSKVEIKNTLKDSKLSVDAMNGEGIPQKRLVAENSRQTLTVISEDDKSLPPSRPATPSLKATKGKSAKTKEKIPKFTSSVSSTKFSDVGGCDACINNIGRLVFHLKHPEVFRVIGIKPPRGFLLHGPPGCGKTLLANAIAGELGLPFFKIASTELVSGISGETEQTIRALFQEAITAAPSILFIDEIDSIASKRENAGKEMEKRIVTQLLSCLDELSTADSNVLVIGASNRIDTLDPALRRAGRFDHEIALGIPDRNARKKILQVLCRDLKLSEKLNFDEIALKTPGFVGADLQSLIREAALCAVNRSFESFVDKMNVSKSLFQEEENSDKNQENKPSSDDSTCIWLHDKLPFTKEQLNDICITNTHFDEALPQIQPSSIREGFATVPDVTWKDIGALEDIREELRMAIMAPVQNPLQFESLGLTTPPGILLVGPPGCGKTLLAKAVANEAGINFISVKGPELLNMYVGESERAVRQVFERARNSSPCVIFFDEIDALCPKRSTSGESTASSRVVNQLLTEMDGLIARKQVFLMAATNRPDILDRAILRPGRLDKSLYVGLPAVEDRIKILSAITKNGTKPVFDQDVTVERIASDTRTDGFSGADLKALVREASIAALKEYMSNDLKPTSLCIAVKLSHVDAAFSKVKASVSEQDRTWYEKMKERKT